jgi:hypothetical protein
MKRLILVAVALLALTGCDDAVIYGDISIGFGTGYVYYQSTGWYTETTVTSLTATAFIEQKGDAQIQKGEWAVVGAPLGVSPILSNPFSSTTLITFPTPGVYRFEYRVDWWHDGELYRTVAPVEFVVYPTGLG